MGVAVSFGLLGTFDWRVDGNPVDLWSPNSRMVLSALLVEPGRLVPVDELLEAVWGERQPSNPRGALHVSMTRVRASLAAAGLPALVVSAAGGYRADVEPGAVDVVRFQRSIAEAVGAAARHDADGQYAALSSAIALWRGEPFADVPSDFLHARYGVRLSEQRLQALEQRAERQLLDGRHEELIGELAEITALFPLRERLWAQYMTALHRAGRRADALNAYHASRRRLADDLGVEPGPELVQLYGEILRGAKQQSGTGSAGNPVVPRQLPPEVSGFAGRSAEVRRLDECLEKYERVADGRPSVVVVTGMPGVGKTALAAHWARRVADRFPDGQIWLDLGGYDRRAPAKPQQSIVSMLHALGERVEGLPRDLAGRTGLYRSAVDGRRMLVVLDNANCADQVLPLIPGDARTFVLITSRNDLAPLIARAGAHPFRLDPLTAPDARQLLESRLGVERVNGEANAVSGIIDICYGLPLALAIVAARAAGRRDFPLRTIERHLRSVGNPLDRFAGPAAALDARSVLSWSYRCLSPPAAHLFRRLGLVPTDDVSVEAAAALVDAAKPQVRLRLDELAAAHLVAEHLPNRFKVHDLLRAYAAELAAMHDPPEQRSADLHRMLDWLTRSVLNARPLLQPSDSSVTPPPSVTGAVSAEPLSFGSERAATQWCDAERDNLVAGVDMAFTHGFDDLCWRLAYASWICLQLAGAWDDVLHSQETGLRAAQRLGEPNGQGHMLAGMATAYRSTGKTARALDAGHTALRIFSAAGNTTGAASAMNNLCAIYRDAGDYQQALRYGSLAYTLEEAIEQPGNMAISVYQMAMTLLAAGRPHDAASYVSKALGLFRQIGHRRGEARGLQLAATVHTRLGRHAAAIEHYHAAVGIYRELADRPYEAAVLSALGDVLTESRRIPEGRDAWRSALAIYDELGTPSAAEVRAKLANLV
jgi:DNA-binding SARP family transcriptional activator/tetratricopeptide (TPR) repeat protein